MAGWKYFSIQSKVGNLEIPFLYNVMIFAKYYLESREEKQVPKSYNKLYKLQRNILEEEKLIL